ncbi:MAG: thermonuclease family protein [Nanoarchaeota archaeon]
MKTRDKQKLLLLVLILFLFGANYPILDKVLKNWLSNYEVGIAERVIDGDTIVVNGSHVRLLGINTPEKGELYYSQAKNFTENTTLGQFVKMEVGKQNLDLYGRKLRYIFANGENVNLEIVKNGFANPYFPEGKDKYYNDFVEAWNECISKSINLCEKSEDVCANCIELKEFNVDEQKVVFSNKCSFKCDMSEWKIKDEGRKVFTFPNFVLENDVAVEVGNKTDTNNILYWEGKDYVWTKTGDTLFLRDDKGKLVLWKRY